MRLAVFFSGALLGLLAVTPIATESTSNPGTTSHRTTKSHRTTTQRPTTTTTHTTNTTGTTSRESPTATHSPATTSSHQNTTVHPTSNNATLPCCPESSRSPPQDPPQSAVYLNFMAVEYNVSFPQAVQWTFSVQNSSLRDLQTPLGQSFSCRNASIIVSPALHLDLLSLKLQAAQLSPSGDFGPSPLETPRVQEVESYTAHTQRHFGDSRPFSLNFEQCSKLEEDKMAPSRWTERKLFPFLSEWMTGLPGLTVPKDHSTYRTTQIPPRKAWGRPPVSAGLLGLWALWRLPSWAAPPASSTTTHIHSSHSNLQGSPVGQKVEVP
nr:macrosialin-like [Odocoileus virginianus texanus]